MTQNPNPHRIFSLFLSQRTLFIAGIGWLGGISLLSTGMATAQTAAPAVDSAAVPSAQDLLMPAEPPVQLQAEPLVDAAPTVEQLITPTAPESIAPVTPVAPAIDSLGSEPSIEPSSPASEALVSPQLEDNAKAVFENGMTGSYIDSTPYSLGATSPDVVLSERSTGCQAVLQAGQAVPTSICPPAPAVAAGGYPEGGYATVSAASSGRYEGAVPLPSVQDFYNLTVRPPALLGNGNLKLVFPLSIPAAITSAFGWRIHPIAAESRFHSGTDLGAPMGTPVVAAFDGKVQIADLLGGYGLAVVLRHNKDTEETLYGHLSEIFVKPGETVKQGEVIGRVGSTGYSTGPHLHFEFHKLTPQGWVTLDPGQALEFSLTQMIEGLKPGAVPKPLPFAIRWESLKKALEMAERQKPQQAATAQPVKPRAEQPISTRAGM